MGYTIEVSYDHAFTDKDGSKLYTQITCLEKPIIYLENKFPAVLTNVLRVVALFSFSK